MRPDELSDFELFSDLAADELERVAAACESIDVLHGTDLTGVGDFAHKFFIILDGEVEVTRDGTKVATMQRGDFFGEVGLLTGNKRNARVMARGRVQLARMMHWDFTELTEALPAFAARLDSVIQERTSAVVPD